ncbi:MAG: hypothetical protein JWN89_451 [Parcubacteria group bacterium]|nr:hypothetical protein [Parcubacteria group bacterium]
MGRKTVTECDCRCGAKADGLNPPGWIVVTQPTKPLRDSDPKIKSEILFSSLKCLGRWATLAAGAASEMQEEARHLRPRGTFVRDDVAGLYV